MTDLRWIQSLIAYGKQGKYTITYDQHSSRWVCGWESYEAELSHLSGRKTLAGAIEWCEHKEGKE